MSLAPIQSTHAPLGGYSSINWLPDGRIVVQYAADVTQSGWKPGNKLLVMNAQGDNVQPINYSPDSRCRFVDFISPTLLPTGQIAFQLNCEVQQGADANIVTWDLKTNNFAPLYSYNLPRTANFNFTFAADMSFGIASSFSDINHKLYLLTKDSVTPIDLGFARAKAAALSPDGKSVAFFGDQSMGGPIGPAWAVQSTNLWLMSSDCLLQDRRCAPTVLVSNIRETTRVSWSPDGAWLAFDGSLDETGDGIWLMRIKTSELIKVVSGRYSGTSWSSDGNKIAVIGNLDPSEDISVYLYHDSLFILDVSTLVAPNPVSTP
jgi:WD40 repeat protein